jgi:hypothetical protein
MAALVSTAAAFDDGQWNDVPEDVRTWFKSLRSPIGGLCCDVADGHRTDWQIRPAGYFIPNPLEPLVNGMDVGHARAGALAHPLLHDAERPARLVAVDQHKPEEVEHPVGRGCLPIPREGDRGEVTLT